MTPGLIVVSAGSILALLGANAALDFGDSKNASKLLSFVDMSP